MKNGILTIMRKELARFFGDRRVLFTTLLLPGLMIYLVYSFMGDAIASSVQTDEGYVPSVYAVNLPDSVEAMAQEMNYAILPAALTAQIKDGIRDQNTDLLLVFSPDFDANVSAYEASSMLPAPSVEIFYNSSSTSSTQVYSVFVAMLDSYEATLTNKFDVNRDVSMSYDLVSKEDSSAFLLSGLMPMLLILFLFQGCMSIAPESIAGEKERGTIATLLVTPLKRRDLAVGKLLSLSILSLMCGLSSAVGTILSLPKLMGAAEDQISLNIYTAMDYMFLGILIAATVLLLVGLVSVISAFAKTIKEATTAVMPLMVVVMLVGASAMFSQNPQSDTTFYLIPLYNSVQSLVGIFSRNYDMTNILISVFSNLVYAVLAGFALTKMFNSEKVVFAKV